jgi:hypothetical protein
MEIIAVAIGLYALTRLMGDMTEGQNQGFDPDADPPVSVLPDKDMFKIESVYSNGSYTLFCLYQLEGGAYLDPASGIITDNSQYVKVGHIVGDPLGTGFITEATGGYDFTLDGVEYTNVRIFTEANGKAYIDSKVEPEEDPLAPETQPEDGTPSPSPSPSINPTPSFGSSMNGYRRSGVL